MLTRLEVDGFKNLLDFSVDFGPYTCIAGVNAVGKSNIFDAIEFISLLADNSFMEAAQKLREVGARTMDPSSLFWQDHKGQYSNMLFATEMIVPPEVEDDFGRTVRPTTSFLRYELELRYRQPDEKAVAQFGSIELVREELRHIKLGDAPGHLPWPHSKKNFRDSAVFGRRSGIAYISTQDDHGEGVVNVHQDGGSRGQPRTSPANRAPRTIVSTTTASDDPTILAARREMQQWRVLALEPSAMRAPDAVMGVSEIAANGAHLAAALFRMAADAGDDVYGEVAAEAAALVDVRLVNVDYDSHRDLLTLQAQLGTGPVLPARSLSDGTLRFIALCIIGLDDHFGGVLCMEEPENGIHPSRIQAMVELVRDLAVDPFSKVDVENPLRQVIVNTHSPYFVQFQEANDLMLALPVTVKRGAQAATSIRLLPIKGTWRAPRTNDSVTRPTIVDYLINPPGTQLKLELPEAAGG
ncbi:AAA family ATPase [Phycicoccus flavus]|uniref:AAA family ATPase n=1 Tax=Phycicoccus flavus TaxID=2502783 RepID=UPI000FEBDA52|nr:ATP-binding protein [Phycicoccus flavus]NHA69410.1 AAA family ATPase [Phycicoccus flavus]